MAVVVLKRKHCQRTQVEADLIKELRKEFAPHKACYLFFSSAKFTSKIHRSHTGPRLLRILGI